MRYHKKNHLSWWRNRNAAVLQPLFQHDNGSILSLGGTGNDGRCKLFLKSLSWDEGVMRHSRDRINIQVNQPRQQSGTRNRFQQNGGRFKYVTETNKFRFSPNPDSLAQLHKIKFFYTELPRLLSMQLLRISTQTLHEFQICGFTRIY